MMNIIRQKMILAPNRPAASDFFVSAGGTKVGAYPLAPPQSRSRDLNARRCHCNHVERRCRDESLRLTWIGRIRQDVGAVKAAKRRQDRPRRPGSSDSLKIMPDG
jgi:hypothetical protein